MKLKLKLIQFKIIINNHTILIFLPQKLNNSTLLSLLINTLTYMLIDEFNIVKSHNLFKKNE